MNMNWLFHGDYAASSLNVPILILGLLLGNLTACLLFLPSKKIASNSHIAKPV